MGGLFGGGGGGSAPSTPSATSQNVTTSNIAPWAQSGVSDLINAGMGQVFQTNPDGTINTNQMKGYTPFNANTPAGNEWVQGAAGSVAGFSPLQLQAQQNIANMQTPGQYGQAMDMSTMSGLGALGTTGQAGQYGQMGLGAGLAGMQAGNAYGQNATNPNAVAAYMNPYIQNTLNPALQLQNQQFGQIGAQNQGQATQQGAFGGGRQAVMQGLNQQNQMLAQNQLVGNAYNQAYNTANQNMQTAGSQAMQGAGLGISGAQAGLQGVGAQQAGYGQLGSQATNLGNLAGAQTQTGLNIAQAQQGAGATQQQNQQNILNQAMANYNTAQTMPMTQLAQLESMYTGAPQNITSSTYSAAPNTVSQLAGLGTAAIGASKLMGATGGLPKEFKVKKFKEGKRVKEDDTQEWLDMLNFSANAPSARYVEGLGMQTPPPMINGRVGANVDALGGNVRAGLSGTAMMTPDKQIVTKPGMVDVGYKTAQNSEYDPYLDMNAYRSINAIPGKGYAQGVNAKYTIPFVSGGIASGVPAPKLDAMLGRLDDQQLAMKADPRNSDPQTAQAALSQQAFRAQMRPAGIGQNYNFAGAGGGIVAFAAGDEVKDDSSDLRARIMQDSNKTSAERVAEMKALMPSDAFATDYANTLKQFGTSGITEKAANNQDAWRMIQGGIGLMGNKSPFFDPSGAMPAIEGHMADVKGREQQKMDLAKQQFELGKFGYNNAADLVKAAQADEKATLANLTKIYGDETTAKRMLESARISAGATIQGATITAGKNMADIKELAATFEASGMPKAAAYEKAVGLFHPSYAGSQDRTLASLGEKAQTQFGIDAGPGGTMNKQFKEAQKQGPEAAAKFKQDYIDNYMKQGLRPATESAPAPAAKAPTTGGNSFDAKKAAAAAPPGGVFVGNVPGTNKPVYKMSDGTMVVPQ